MNHPCDCCGQHARDQVLARPAREPDAQLERIPLCRVCLFVRRYPTWRRRWALAEPVVDPKTGQVVR